MLKNKIIPEKRNLVLEQAFISIVWINLPVLKIFFRELLENLK